MNMRIEAPVLPREHEAVRSLPWVFAILSFLLTLALGCALLLSLQIANWRGQLEHRLTIEIPSDNVSNDMLIAIRDRLQSDPAVEEASLLTREEVAALLAPLLGSDSMLESITLPYMFDVHLDPAASIDLAALETELRDIAPNVILDHHEDWRVPILRLSNFVKWLAVGVAVTIGLAIVALVIFATRASFVVHRAIIEVLHFLGATDAFIAQSFQQRAFTVAVVGAAVGLLGAIFVALVLRVLFIRMAPELIAQELTVAPIYAVLLLLPLLIAGIAMLTARLTVLATLRTLQT